MTTVYRTSTPIEVPIYPPELRQAMYHKFLEDKMHIASLSGIDVALAAIHPALRTRPFEHQAAITQWALRGGQRLIAASFGLGKTTMTSECMRQVHLKTGEPTLIVGELNVRHQFQQEDGPRLGMDIVYVGNDTDVKNCRSPYMYTNYERVRDGAISPKTLNRFAGLGLDEASVLADYGSKTFQTFCTLFRDTRYKFCASATPARNKYKELLHYAHFLGIADSGQALTRYFKRNSTKANELTLMESMEEEFWMWVSSWAIFIEKPSDLGFPDDGYVLPEIDIQWQMIPTDHEAAQQEADGWGQFHLFANAAQGVTQASREKRRSMDDRLVKMMEIINQYPDESFLLWHNLEDERRAINKLLPVCVDVYGSQDIEEKEDRLMRFSRGEFKYLSTKPSIAGRGCNFQHYCHNMIFVGVGYSFEEIIQALHRLYRFRQMHKVRCWFIYTEAEQEIVNSVLAKWRQHDILVGNTTAIIKKFGLMVESMKSELRRTIGVNRREVKGNGWTAIHNDVIAEIPNMANNSIDMICTSIPFGNQYEYTETKNDMGYNEDNQAFWQQMDFLIPELLRVLKPGRIAAIHVKDRIRFGNVTGEGVPTLEPFSDDCSFAFRKHGFLQLCRRTVVNDVVRENNQTYRLGYSMLIVDSTTKGSGTPEYWLVFRKPHTDKTRGFADEPVTHNREDYSLMRWQIDASEYWRSSGNRLLKPEEIKALSPDDLADMDINQVYRWFREYSRRNIYDYRYHVELGSKLAENGRLPKTFMLFAPSVPTGYSHSVDSVHDYTRMRVLQNRTTYRRMENHVCPLPLDLIERMIELYSNPGDLVFDPFGGIGSTPYQALSMGRRSISTELNETYFDAACIHLNDIEAKMKAPTLFDLMAMEAHPANIGVFPQAMEVAA